MALEWTPLRPADVDAVHGLVRRWEVHWKTPIVTPREEIAEDLDHPHVRPELDTRGVWSGDKLVAYGVVQHTPSGTRLERVFAAGKVDPEVCGTGIGRHLLAWQIERAAELLRRCDPSLPWFVRTYEWEWIESAHHLYARMGMIPVRWFEELVRPLAEPLEVSAPGDVEILAWEDADPEEIRQVSNAAFADHWGSTPRDPAAWHHVVVGSGMRPDLSWVAVADGRVVGICLNAHYPADEEVTGRVDGWVEHLGVLQEWRRRGVAAALIARSLQSFREQGFSHAMLGVDADNPTGASGLYRRLGFEPLHRSIASELQIPAVGEELAGR